MLSFTLKSSAGINTHKGIIHGTIKYTCTHTQYLRTCYRIERQFVSLRYYKTQYERI